MVMEGEELEEEEEVGRISPKAPRVITGTDVVNDLERQLLRTSVPSLDSLDRIFGIRQLDDAKVDYHTTNFGMRRWLQVALPPELTTLKEEEEEPAGEEKAEPGSEELAEFAKEVAERIGEKKTKKKKKLPLERRCLFVRRPRGDLTPEEQAQIDRGELYYAAQTKAYRPASFGSAVNETEELAIIGYPYRFWVLDIDRAEHGSRQFTGFLRLPKEEVARQWEALWGKKLRRAVAHRNPALTLAEEHQLLDTYWQARRLVWKKYLDYRAVVETFDGRFVPSGLEEKEFYLLTVCTERYRFWKEMEARMQAKGSQTRPQTVFESIDAYEAAADMVSAVMEPLLVDENGQVLRGTEMVRYISLDEMHDLRKQVDGYKQGLMLWRAKAQMLLAEGTVKSAPDNWFPASYDDVRKRDLILPGLPVPPRVYLGPLADLQDDTRIPPGPELGARHLRLMHRMLESFRSLVELAAFVRTGGVLTYKDLVERWIGGKQMIQYEPDEVIWTWWDEESDLQYWEPDPKGRRKPHAALREDWMLWIDWPLVMGSIGNYVFEQVVLWVNERFAEAGLPVRVTCDGPDSNYFRHHDIAWEIWRNQPHNPLIERLKEVWNTEVRKKTIHIRPVYYREVLAGLSGGLLKGLSRPDPEFLAYLRDKTKAELARLRGPTGRVPERDREQEKELTRRLAKLNEWLIEATPLDEFTKFVQRLNRLSDRRVRLWAGFQTHGKSGSLMGFEIGEAKAFVKEGYGTDNGHHLEEQQNWQADLIMMGWLCGQFTKALYLARGLSILISASVNPFERHKAEAAAVQGGLHPDIARHVVEGFKGLDNLLLPLDEPAAAEYVKAIFAAKEIRQLGRDVAKEILERGEFRKEMDAMIIA